MTTEDKHLFYAQFSRYGTSALSRVRVTKEMPKTYDVVVADSYFGSGYVNKRKRKDDPQLFETKRQAVAWLISRHRQFIQKKEEQLYGVKDQLEGLEQIFDALGLVEELA